MQKKFIVDLTSKEREWLRELVKKGEVAGYKTRHSQMLLKAVQSKHGPAWPDESIAELFGAHSARATRL